MLRIKQPPTLGTGRTGSRSVAEGVSSNIADLRAISESLNALAIKARWGRRVECWEVSGSL